MRMDLGLTQTIKQIQTLSPQMYMSMEILCMNSLDLEERIETELENNVALEVADKPGDGEADAEASGEAESSGEDDGTLDERLVERWDQIISDEDEYAPRRVSSRHDGDRDEKLDALNNTEDRPHSLGEHLEEQLHLLTPEDLDAMGVAEGEEEQILSLAREILYNLDERGYLRYPIEEIHRALIDQIRRAFADVRRLDEESGAQLGIAPSEPLPDVPPPASPGDAAEEGAATRATEPDAGGNGSGALSRAEAGPEAGGLLRGEESAASSASLAEQRSTTAATLPFRVSEETDAGSPGTGAPADTASGASDADDDNGARDTPPRQFDEHELEETLHLAVEFEDSRLPTIEQMRQALHLVQQLEPPGIGGVDLKECLLLQLERDHQPYPVETRIIQDHLDDLANNRLPKIAKALGISIDEVKMASETISSLNPIPGKLYGGGPPQYIKPDVIVEEVNGKYEVQVTSDYLPRLRVSDYYLDLYKRSRKDPELKKFIKKKLESAEWLLSAIRQRQSTLERIAREIVAIQRDFFEHGVSRLKPLKMVDVAERVGVHVSTISRAISGKYAQTPQGLYDLKFFFTGGAQKSDGTVEARVSVIQRIKDLIAEEDKSKPLSDVEIQEKLEESGIKISRRTVTKYREAESIPSSRQRREY